MTLVPCGEVTSCTSGVAPAAQPKLGGPSWGDGETVSPPLPSHCSGAEKGVTEPDRNEGNWTVWGSLVPPVVQVTWSPWAAWTVEGSISMISTWFVDAPACTLWVWVPSELVVTLSVLAADSAARASEVSALAWELAAELRSDCADAAAESATTLIAAEGSLTGWPKSTASTSPVKPVGRASLTK